MTITHKMAKWYTIVFMILAALYIIVYSQKVDTEFTINEELAISTQVGNIAAVPDLFPGISDRDRSSLQYGILNQASSPASLFNISRTGGIIYVARRIDREALCPMVPNCILKINILASSQTSSQFDSRVLTVNIAIVDINDNSPTFERSAVVLKVTEGSSLGSVLKITGANDKDFKTEYKVKNYTLDIFKDVFALSSTQTLDGSSEIDLILKQALDRETKSQYVFTVTAYDGGSPPKSSVLTVTVDVTDINDNEPVFVNNSYNVTIDSKNSLNKVILQVSANDADEGNDAHLTYDFSNLQKPMLENIFQINATTGEIAVIGPLRPGVMEFFVEVQDSGVPKLKAQTVVTVYVVSSGNTSPRISITTVGANSDQNVVTILEPAGRGLFVAFALVEDDGGDDVLCQISNEVFRMEPVASKGYKVVLQGTVDRETTPSYDLTVSCIDSGNPPLNATVQFTVKIEDANDNAPEFSQPRYSRTITEGRKNGEFVLQVSAHDKDAGLNSAIRYSLDPDYARFFNIDPHTGVISAIGELDREAHPAMTFKVYATDQGKSQQNNGSTDISIVLDDINDNVPELTSKVFRFQTVEEQATTRLIGNLEAHDADEGVNGELEFFFTGSLDGADGAFTVLQNGSVISSAKLDREERVNYSFSAMVRDKGDPPLMSTAVVIVEVIDINDNSPAILFPKSHNHTIVISTLPERGVVVSRIIAYDDDEGDNGSLRFTIVSGNEDTAFEISETTGEFKIAHTSRLKNRKRYDVGIVVSDKGIPPKINTTSLKIDIMYDNATLIAKGLKDKQDDYIIIVAVVAAVTVIFSTIIIVAICIVFQKDKNIGRKEAPRAAFHNLPAPGHLNDVEKVSSIAQESSVDTNYQQYSTNNLSSPHGGNAKHPKDGTFFQLQHSQADSQKPSKVKAVSFSLDELKLGSSSRLTSPKEDLPPFLTFGSSFGHVGDEDTFRTRASMTRQGDDVISDTSGDTNTSDSGRGNSVDDVNFDHMIAGDHSPSVSFRRRSDDLHSPTEKLMSSEHFRKSPNHVRLTDNQRNTILSNQPPTQRQTTKYDNSWPTACQPVRSSSKDVITRTPSQAATYHSFMPLQLTTFGTHGQQSVTSADDDVTTTTSGSYVINPEDIRIDTYVGTDVIV